MWIYLLLLQSGSRVLRWACLSACLPTCISQDPRVRTSPDFLRMLSVVVAWSSSGSVAIRYYVLPVLWVTSCFPIVGLMQQLRDSLASMLWTLTSYTVWSPRLDEPFIEGPGAGVEFAIHRCSVWSLDVSRACSPTLSMTLKNLGALYKRQGKVDAALALENIVSHQEPWQTVRRKKLSILVIYEVL